MKHGLPFLSILLLGASVTGEAFTLDIAIHEVSDFGHGPRSIFLPGYGEVAFESGLDGVLVVDSAYASTERVVLPGSSCEPNAQHAHDDVAPGADPEMVLISNRNTSGVSEFSLHPVEAAIENPSGGWNAVPETASATLGLIGTLLLLLRRRQKARSES